MTQAELQAAQQAEYDALVARVVALEEAVFVTPEEDDAAASTAKGKK